MSDELAVQTELERKVSKVLSDYFNSSYRKVEVDSRLVEDLYIDSIGMVEIVMALNEYFGVELPEAGVEEWKTVKDICNSIGEALG